MNHQTLTHPVPGPVRATIQVPAGTVMVSVDPTVTAAVARVAGVEPQVTTSPGQLEIRIPATISADGGVSIVGSTVIGSVIGGRGNRGSVRIGDGAQIHVTAPAAPATAAVEVWVPAGSVVEILGGARTTVYGARVTEFDAGRITVDRDI